MSQRTRLSVPTRRVRVLAVGGVPLALALVAGQALAGPGTPANDLCENAAPIAAGQTVAGDTTFATPDAVPECSSRDYIAPSAWYTFVGTGNAFRAELCGSGYDTKVDVYAGSCDALACVAFNDDFCDVQSRVDFQTVAGETYFILVHGFADSAGPYTLTLTDTGPGIPRPANDACANAESLALGQVVTASTADATDDPEARECPLIGIASGGPGVWYSFVGNGNNIEVATCGTRFDSVVNVYTGECGMLECIGGADQGCGNASLANICSEPGVTYYVLVTGYSTFDQGEFTLSITDVGPCLSNDLCENATHLALPATVAGTTLGSSVDADTAIDCGDAVVFGAGVWYTLTGTGSTIQLTTCGSPTFDSKISVFEGSCGSFACIASDDDACGLGAEVNFCSEPGVTYHVYIHGFGGATGDFTLSAFDTGQPCTPIVRPVNDLCENSLELACTPGAPTVVVLDNTHATNSPSDPDFACENLRGVTGTMWYTFVAGSGGVSIDTCATPDLDSVLALFEPADPQNPCGSLVEIACSDDSRSCGWSAEIRYDRLTPGNRYYVLVAAFGSLDQGVYTLTFSQDACPSACPADRDGNGEVNASDITAFLGDWFADRANGTSNADFNRDGEVGAGDITAYLNAWFADRAGGSC